MDTQPAGVRQHVRSRTVTVASVPSSHVYVRHLSAAGDGVHRLPDPHPDDPHRSAEQQWWPPVMLRPDWAGTADFDLLHIQFGFDACSPQELRALVDVLRERDKPLVLTVHDLRNPHHLDRALHDAQLDVLVPAADALITLTRGAADEIRRRWGREAHVVPHPHVLELDEMVRFQARARQRDRGQFRVGVHVKSLRASMAPMRILPPLLEAVGEIPGGVLQVNGHRDVLDPDGARRDEELASWLEDRAAAGEVDLRVHDYFSDAELWDYLASLDACVLPYRFGTHSGWLEACRDVGTAVVAPSCGHYADQGPVHTYVHDEELFEPDSLRQAVTDAHRAGPPRPVGVGARRAERVQVARAHARIYRGLQ